MAVILPSILTVDIAGLLSGANACKCAGRIRGVTKDMSKKRGWLHLLKPQ